MDNWPLRIVQDLIDRLGGPLSLRFLLQPLMSALFAARDGIRDAKTAKPAYFWSFFTDPAHIKDRLREGWSAIGKVFILAIVLDVIYQVIEFRRFYPVEALITALLLAAIPYLLLRGPINRIARLWRGKGAASPSSAAL